MREDQQAIRNGKADGLLKELVDSDLEIAVIGFTIMALFTLVGALAMLTPTARAVSELNVLTRVATPLAFFLAEVLFIVKKVLNIRRRRRQRKLMLLREIRRRATSSPS